MSIFVGGCWPAEASWLFFDQRAFGGNLLRSSSGEPVAKHNEQ